MYTKVRFMLTLTCLLATSCNVSDNTPQPIATIPGISTSIAIQPTPIPTSSLEKPILILYEHDANDSIDYFTACLIGLNTLSFILYEDGHIVLFDKTQFMETTISQAEIEKLLVDIEDTGFFLVKGGGDEFISHPPTPNFIGNSMEIITINERTFTITAGEYQYLINPIKETLQIIKEYKPPRLEPYSPDKLNIWVYPVHDTALTNYDPTPKPPVMEWSYESLPLDAFIFSLNSPRKTISGEYLDFVMQEVKTVPVYRMVKQNGQHYLFMACPAFQR